MAIKVLSCSLNVFSLSLSREELQEKYEGKLTKEMTGPAYEVMGKVMKAIVNRKITVPGGFVG
jgi:Nucleosome-binding factor SPN, POB3 subunit